MNKAPPRSSRQRYLGFVEDYKQGRLDASTEAAKGIRFLRGRDPGPGAGDGKGPKLSPKRRAYMRDYLRWLKPHRWVIATVFVLALVAGVLDMIEPLFMRFIIDHVLLAKGLDAAQRMSGLQLGGLAFLAVVVLSAAIGAVKDYRQRILNTQVMISLRRSLYDRLLHLPLPSLWEMKTGGILSRLTGDVETTTGLLQMAVISPVLALI